MSGFLLSRGLGGSASSLMSIGFIGAVGKIVRGGSRFAKKAIVELSETIKISVMLINTNGKELSKPIFNNMSKVYNTTSDIFIRAIPKTMIGRKSRNIKVTANLRNNYE